MSDTSNALPKEILALWELPGKTAEPLMPIDGLRRPRIRPSYDSLFFIIVKLCVEWLLLVFAYYTATCSLKRVNNGELVSDH